MAHHHETSPVTGVKILTCFLTTATTGLHHLTGEIPLKEFVSGSPELSSLKETDRGGSSQHSLPPLYARSIIFAFGLTIILLLHIFLGDSLAGLQDGVPGMLRGLHHAQSLYSIVGGCGRQSSRCCQRRFQCVFRSRLPNLAGALEADLSNCYDGNFSQERVDEVIHFQNSSNSHAELLCHNTSDSHRTLHDFTSTPSSLSCRPDES
ncbi:unnamed protein product [Pleuronectes platessa]|uniref:Uncharacterized protein n=1 Tax=Pleuronectes platessa TaxID=8262 RepID=A0A9N7UV59_PLEPL|nr:unnamed protein product [Pleuronectes platessa]